MSNLISLGAIHKVTNKYVYPTIAKKADEHFCPDCNNDVIVVQGEILRHHFRHKSDKGRPCYYYDKPHESQIHKDAKLLMKTLLENKTQIEFTRKCQSCQVSDKIKLPEMTKDSIITSEHRFTYNNAVKIADVAHTLNGEIQCIYEICHTHKTSDEDRPEPWVEINAESLIKSVNNKIAVLHNLVFNILCKRRFKCDSCIKFTCQQAQIQQEQYEEMKRKMQEEQQEKIKQEQQEQQERMKQIENNKIKNTMNLIRGLNRIKFVYLNVPYEQKDYMKKSFSLKWETEHRLWYISREKYETMIMKKKDELEQYVVWWVCEDCENMNAICDDCWKADICLTSYIVHGVGNQGSINRTNYTNNMLSNMTSMKYLHPTARLKALYDKLSDYIIQQPPEPKLKNAKNIFMNWFSYDRQENGSMFLLPPFELRDYDGCDDYWDFLEHGFDFPDFPEYNPDVVMYDKSNCKYLIYFRKRQGFDNIQHNIQQQAYANQFGNNDQVYFIDPDWIISAHQILGPDRVPLTIKHENIFSCELE